MRYVSTFIVQFLYHFFFFFLHVVAIGWPDRYPDRAAGIIRIDDASIKARKDSIP